MEDPRVPAVYAEAVRSLFRQHGYQGPFLVIDDDLTEAVLLVPAEALPKIREPELSTALQALLGRKVWVVEASPGWMQQEPHPFG